MTQDSDTRGDLSLELGAAWRSLGAPKDLERAVVLAPAGFEVARAVKRTLKPRSLQLQHAGPLPARAGFQLCDDDIRALPAGGFDLVVASHGLDVGAPAAAVDRMRSVVDLAAPGGVILVRLATFAAPDEHPGVGPLDPVLFPHGAAVGDLGPSLRDRTPLPASAWFNLLMAAGLTVEAVCGYHAQPIAPADTALHGPRLNIFDAGELQTGVVHVLARASGGGA